MTKYLYHISQDHTNKDWDTYDSAVVAASTEEEARLMHPNTHRENSWCHPKYVKVRCIGVANPGESGVICASFNAG